MLKCFGVSRCCEKGFGKSWINCIGVNSTSLFALFSVLMTESSSSQNTKNAPMCLSRGAELGSMKTLRLIFLLITLLSARLPTSNNNNNNLGHPPFYPFLTLLCHRFGPHPSCPPGSYIFHLRANHPIRGESIFSIVACPSESLDLLLACPL